VTRGVTPPIPPPVTGYEVCKIQSNNGKNTQYDILYTSSVDQVNGGVYTHSAWVLLTAGTYAQIGQHWNPWDPGPYQYIPLNVWTRIQYTVTNSANNYGSIANCYGTDGTIYVTAVQYEQGSPMTNFIGGAGATRSSTQSILDMTGNNTITSNSLTYNSDGSFSFNGSSSDLRTPLFTTATGNLTMNGWFYVNLGTVGTFMSNGNDPGGYCIGIGQYFSNADNQVVALFGYIRWILTGVYYQYTGWTMVTMTLDSSGVPSIYINGTLIGTYPGTIANTPSAGTGFCVGSQWGIRYSNTKSGNVQFYNRALSASEVQQTFNAFRGRYGI
jgi:hypothetical protein